MKKSQGLSLNMMVIAALAIIVLVVSIAIYTGFISGKAVPFLGERTECDAQPDSKGCVKSDSECRDGHTVYGLGCPEKKDSLGPYCCIRG